MMEWACSPEPHSRPGSELSGGDPSGGDPPGGDPLAGDEARGSTAKPTGTIKNPTWI
jgi:hypothetical protein